jgi:hypothetical protein
MSRREVASAPRSDRSSRRVRAGLGLRPWPSLNPYGPFDGKVFLLAASRSLRFQVPLPAAAKPLGRPRGEDGCAFGAATHRRHGAGRARQPRPTSPWSEESRRKLNGATTVTQRRNRGPRRSGAPPRLIHPPARPGGVVACRYRTQMPAAAAARMHGAALRRCAAGVLTSESRLRAMRSRPPFQPSSLTRNP